jgi:magnesium-transporting ATPase (P-type)
LLGLTHEVVPDQDKAGNKIYQGPSPDEVALVDAAKKMQYEFMQSNQSETIINIRGTNKTFKLLYSFPFTSDRKRMSIIVRDPRDNKIRMFTKGVNILLFRLTQSLKDVLALNND